MARPLWSGQFQISLVSFGIQLFAATESKAEIHFHQLNRRTGERVRHQNVSDGDDLVEKDEIVKGYEYSKGEYVMIEPEEIENLRIASRQTLSVEQFVDLSELSPKFFERPYFAVPENPSQAEAFGVVRKAMQASGKAALGKIAFGGREHLVAVTATTDDKEPGMMAYTLRYASELRDPGEYFAGIKEKAIDRDQLRLAAELIRRKTVRFNAEAFHDEYESALRTMVEAKIKHLPLPKDKPAVKAGKVVNLMDALRKSVEGGATTEKKAPKKALGKAVKAAGSGEAKGRNNKLAVVGGKKSGARTPRTASRRKSA